MSKLILLITYFFLSLYISYLGPDLAEAFVHVSYLLLVFILLFS